MKKLLSFFVLAAVFATVEAKVHTDTVTTPIGLEISLVGVHNRIHVAEDDRNGCERRCSYGLTEFAHGNYTIRMVVNNPTPAEQPLKLEIPVQIGYGVRSGGGMKCVVTRMVPSGKDNIIDIAVPHVGMMSGFFSVCNWKITDASGKRVDVECWLDGCDARRFTMRDDAVMNTKYQPAYDDFGIAVSVGILRTDEFVERFEKELKKADKHCINLDFDLNRPDFSRFRDWRDFACYDALVFTETDWSRLGEAGQELVKDYEAAGGKLFVVDSLDAIDSKKLCDAMVRSNDRLRGYGKRSVFKSDKDAMASVAERKNPMPFASIVLVLLLFSIVAGPVAFFMLAKRDSRIHILWVFPVVSIVFSVAVALTIVFANGLSVKVTEFVCEEELPELGRKVVVRNTVYIAPFPMSEPIRCPSDALVTVDSGSDKTSGDRILFNPEGIELVGNWTPCLWPVRVRTMEVIRTGKEASK